MSFLIGGGVTAALAGALPLVITDQCGKRPVRSALAPMPLAIATRPRAHPRGIGSFRSEHRAGAASSVPRSALSLTRAVLRSMADALSFMRTALVPELLTALDNLPF
jgi:hypothetical protein